MVFYFLSQYFGKLLSPQVQDALTKCRGKAYQSENWLTSGLVTAWHCDISGVVRRPVTSVSGGICVTFARGQVSCPNMAILKIGPYLGNRRRAKISNFDPLWQKAGKAASSLEFLPMANAPCPNMAILKISLYLSQFNFGAPPPAGGAGGGWGRFGMEWEVPPAKTVV